ncbi:MAG TPA: hypothetical protein VE553_07635 [Candidatus Binatia bacterium]|nr:hypothetical protein [Candidatus Binatia bacterium]
MINEPSKISKLRDLIAEGFNKSELQVLCLDVGVDYEELPGETLSLKAQELVSYCYRHNRTEELVTVCKQARPHAAWTRLDDRYDEDAYLPDNQPLVQTPKLGKVPRRLEREEVEQFLAEFGNTTE